jgi:RNA polymerase sigma-70 factor (ECF subfamily)
MTEKEAQLVTSAKNGDSSAFEELYTRYYKKIFALARMTVKNEADAEDILQQAFVNAWRSLPNLANPKGFNTWLQKITW